MQFKVAELEDVRYHLRLFLFDTAVLALGVDKLYQVFARFVDDLGLNSEGL